MVLFRKKRDAFLNSCESTSPMYGCGLISRNRKEAMQSIAPKPNLVPFNPPSILLDVDEPQN
eukprot:m.107577 g.107577  ORF g.107577 m.107577 type:complete len:62 (-) comp12692_c0_seq1:507-692(-)